MTGIKLALLFLPFLFGCLQERHSVSEYPSTLNELAQRSLQIKTPYPHSQEAILLELGAYLSHRHNYGKVVEPYFAQKFTLVCPKHIQWDTVFTVAHYRPATMFSDAAIFQDIVFGNTQKIRVYARTENLGDLIEPLGIGPDLPNDCENCPDSSALQRKQSHCERHIKGESL